MHNKNNIVIEELIDQCVRARRAESQLAELQGMLDGLDLVLWQTDGELRLTASYGSAIAVCFHNRPITDFYRDAFGLDEPDAEPLAAHRDARRGEHVTVAWKSAGKQYAMMVHPQRDSRGQIIGTVGMTMRLAT